MEKGQEMVQQYKNVLKMDSYLFQTSCFQDPWVNVSWEGEQSAAIYSHVEECSITNKYQQIKLQ